jgi:hypothetical protein
VTDTLQQPATKQEFLDYVNSRWNAFVAQTDRLTDDRWTGPTDAAGWTAKDHVAHVTAWDRSFIEHLRNQTPQQQTLGVSDAAWTAGGYDAMNEEIRQRTIDLPVDEVQAERDKTWIEILELVSGFSEEEFAGPGKSVGFSSGEKSVLELLIADLPNHYDEHRGYIEIIVTEPYE